jgi:hypothetical protein
MSIYAKVLQDSINSAGNRLTTFEIQLPKVLLAEFNTHSMVRRNFSSSRAIPAGKFQEIESFFPLYYGANQSGMQAKQTEITDIKKAEIAWRDAIFFSKQQADKLSKLGLHKQWANRPNDWHVMAKGVTSATEWDNFFWLRDDESAQPEMQELAKQMKQAMQDNKPMLLKPGELHVPYIERHRYTEGDLEYYSQGEIVSEKEALKISASACAQVSYRRLDESYEKAMDIYAKLFSGPKPHMSPTEHQGICMKETKASIWKRVFPDLLEKGVSHIDREGNLWSAAFKGFIQQRKVIEQTKQ